MRMLMAAITRALVDASRPWIGVAGGVCERGEGLAQVHVAGPAERDCAVLAGLARHGRCSALGGEVVGRHEAAAIVAELGEQLRGADPPAAKQRGDDLAIRMRVDRVLDGGAERRELRNERSQDGNERAYSTRSRR